MSFRRVLFVFICAWTVVPSLYADFMILEGNSESETTGEQFEGVSSDWATHPVIEIDGLSMSACTTNAAHELNANSGEFGIYSKISNEEEPGFFDVGEMMVFYFDKDVEIYMLDMNSLRDDDRFVIKIGDSDSVVITYNDLSNKTRGYYSFLTPQRIAKETEIRLYATNGSVGMDRIELQVVPEPMAAGLISFTGIGLLLIRRFFAV